MRLEFLRNNFEKRKVNSNIEYIIFKPASEAVFENAEAKVGSPFPYQVKLFYQYCNGLYVNDPFLHILQLEDTVVLEKCYWHFANISSGVRLGLNISQINLADQWDIINIETKLVITRTMASFWSNKIWKWIDNRECFWQPKSLLKD